jgi:hypothetical protein
MAALGTVRGGTARDFTDYKPTVPMTVPTWVGTEAA